MNIHTTPPSRASLGDAHIGIDIGRVIIGAVDARGHADTSFLQGSEAMAMATPPSDHSFEVIQALARETRGRVWLVSKAGPRVQALTRKWLAHWRFFESTGVPASHLRFCRERRDKAVHARQLRLTHFIDDRLDVLTHLRGVVPQLYLFGHQTLPTLPGWLCHAPSWTSLSATWSLPLGPGIAEAHGR